MPKRKSKVLNVKLSGAVSYHDTIGTKPFCTVELNPVEGDDVVVWTFSLEEAATIAAGLMHFVVLYGAGGTCDGVLLSDGMPVVHDTDYNGMTGEGTEDEDR